jgi:hypothetical protein
MHPLTLIRLRGPQESMATPSVREEGGPNYHYLLRVYQLMKRVEFLIGGGHVRCSFLYVI